MNRGVVKIISSNVDVDWFNPYKNKDNNESIGTGFFINKDGYILTCAHVVDSSIKTFFTVPAHSKEQRIAVLISICYDKDVALLKAVDYTNLDFLELDDSDQVKQGDTVQAVGYPLGQDRLKLTSGVISGRQGRYIQTDTPINPGNSGGPLLNKDNKVIGINTAKMSSFIADNIGYVTPINDFKIIQEMMFRCTTPTIIRKPMLMCQFNNADKYLMKYLKTPLDCDSGYYIKQIYNCSPLHEAGVRDGDLLCSFDGLKIDNFGETQVDWTNDKVHLFDLLDRYKINDTVKIKYWSLNSFLKTGVQKINESIVKLVETDYKFNIRMIHPPLEKIDYEMIGGITVAPLTINHIANMMDQNIGDTNRYNMKSYLKLENRFEPKLLITNIFVGSYIKTTKTIENGDIIEEINDICVSTLEQFRNAFKHYQIVDGQRFVKVKVINKTMIVLSVDKLLEEEKFLSEQFKYSPSELYKNLLADNPTDSVDVGITKQIDGETTPLKIKKYKFIG